MFRPGEGYNQADGYWMIPFFFPLQILISPVRLLRGVMKGRVVVRTEAKAEDFEGVLGGR